MSKYNSLPRIIAEYGNMVIVDYNNCYQEEPLHSELLKTQKQYVIACAQLCDGQLSGSTSTTLTYIFSDEVKASIFKNSFVRA